jgi:hypothetical protein
MNTDGPKRARDEAANSQVREAKKSNPNLGEQAFSGTTGFQKTSLASLPVDLLFMIAELVPECAKALSLISHKFYDIFHSFRYHYVDVESLKDFRKPQRDPLIVVLKVLLENPDYAAAVRVLTLPCENHFKDREVDSDIIGEDAEYLATKSENFDLSFEPGLPTQLRRGDKLARHLLLLHILPNLKVLRLTDWCGDSEGSLENFFEERIASASGNLDTFRASVPKGLLSLNQWQCSHWDTEMGFDMSMLLPGFLLPKVHTVSGYACCSEDDGREFKEWFGKSNVKNLYFADSLLRNAGLRSLVKLCKCLESYQQSWGSATVGESWGFSRENVTLSEAFESSKRSLQTLAIYDDSGMFRSRGNTGELPTYAGIFKEFNALTTFKIPMPFITPRSRSDDDIDWDATLPNSLKHLYLEDSRQKVKDPYKMLHRLLQRKQIDPSFKLGKLEFCRSPYPPYMRPDISSDIGPECESLGVSFLQVKNDIHLPWSNIYFGGNG